jgi:hypothetical protein
MARPQHRFDFGSLPRAPDRDVTGMVCDEEGGAVEQEIGDLAEQRSVGGVVRADRGGSDEGHSRRHSKKPAGSRPTDPAKLDLPGVRLPDTRGGVLI